MILDLSQLQGREGRGFSRKSGLKLSLTRRPQISYSVGTVFMAEREGFEPSIEFPLYTLSRRAPSTTRPSLQELGLQYQFSAEGAYCPQTAKSKKFSR
jgi:hypothetical protein